MIISIIGSKFEFLFIFSLITMGVHCYSCVRLHVAWNACSLGQLWHFNGSMWPLHRGRHCLISSLLLLSCTFSVHIWGAFFSLIATLARSLYLYIWFSISSDSFFLYCMKMFLLPVSRAIFDSFQMIFDYTKKTNSCTRKHK